MNATQRALLKGIVAAPHDDAPRLVYADWLDEYAAELPKKSRESTAARAEIIRVQCELARLAEEDSDSRWVYEYLKSRLDEAIHTVDWLAVDANLARRIKLHARERQLTTQYQEEWSKAESPAINGVSFGLCRGFWTSVGFKREVEDIVQTAKAVLKHPNYMPAEVLYCDQVLTADEAKQLVASGLTDSLTCVYDSCWERPTLFPALGRTKNAARINAVVPGSSEYDFIAPFAQSANWKGIRSIHVVAWGDHQPRVEPLSTRRHLAGLQSLTLNQDARAHGADISAVANGVWRGLRLIDWDAWLDDDDATTLANGTAMGELRCLRLNHQIGGEGASEVLTSYRLENVAVIDLSRNTIRGLNADALREAERPNLHVLNLASANRDSYFSGTTGLAKADLMALVKSPITHNLRVLNLANNKLTDAAIASFFRAMKMPWLMLLNLSDNAELGSTSVNEIASCDALINLQSLNLARTKIGNDGAKALAKSKHLNKLRHLDVSQAGVTATGLAALRKRFGEDVVRA